jgi:ribosome biogenesis GTPase / thiamine phosphate phosphatase
MGPPPDRHPRRGATGYSPAAKERIARHDVARVIGIDKGHVQILYDGVESTARYAGSMRGEAVVVGDRVRVRPPRHETDVARVLERLDRDTVLTRTPDDAEDEERVVVANADQIAVVVGADYLEGGVGFLDRVMVAASHGGLDTLLILNKVDLVDDLAAVSEIAERYRGLGVLVHLTSALTGEGIDELTLDLAGMWTAFTGHSGVGKTSLFNRLVPEADLEVGELGPRGGRHTTVASRAMHVQELDAWLVDTPGVRSFGLGALRPEELATHFPELRALVCDLDGCLHDDEPGCALPAAIAAGEVHPDRLASYRRLLAGARGES